MSSLDFQKHELAGKRIIVTGAGLAGLAFASAIDQYWPDQHPKPHVVIYERSAKELDVERKGYTMGIKPESGLLALKQLGLLDIALSSSTVGTSTMEQAPTFWTSDWTRMLDLSSVSFFKKMKDGMPRGGIRLVRYVLRDMLLDAVPTQTKIHFRKGCEGVQVLADGRVRVQLSDGSFDECDLLVAADGASSGVRSSILPGEELEYTGASCFLATSRFPLGKPEEFRHRWGMNISGQGVAFLNLWVSCNLQIIHERC